MAKKKGIVGEFKEFIMRGNVIDLAVGVIIGAAFKAIVDSLVADIIMPVVSLATKGIDFAKLFISLNGEKYPTLVDAKAAGAATITYGNFISVIINFIIMAFVIFMIVKGINRLSEKARKKEPEAAPTTKECPFCKSEINVEATKCPNCTSEVG